MTALAPTLQAFFTERLIQQRHASPHTIAAYRNALRLLLVFAATRTNKEVCRLDIADLDAPLVAAFLDHLEHQRGNSIRTRNARLAAIHSLFALPDARPPGQGVESGGFRWVWSRWWRCLSGPSPCSDRCRFLRAGGRVKGRPEADRVSDA